MSVCSINASVPRFILLIGKRIWISLKKNYHDLAHSYTQCRELSKSVILIAPGTKDLEWRYKKGYVISGISLEEERMHSAILSLEPFNCWDSLEAEREKSLQR